MIVEIQVAPKPSGTNEDEYVFVKAAITVLKDSRLSHEVGALGATFEIDAEVARDMKSLTHKFSQTDSENK